MRQRQGRVVGRHDMAAVFQHRAGSDSQARTQFQDMLVGNLFFPLHDDIGQCHAGRPDLSPIRHLLLGIGTTLFEEPLARGFVRSVDLVDALADRQGHAELLELQPGG